MYHSWNSSWCFKRSTNLLQQNQVTIWFLVPAKRKTPTDLCHYLYNNRLLRVKTTIWCYRQVNTTKALQGINFFALQNRSNELGWLAFSIRFLFFRNSPKLLFPWKNRKSYSMNKNQLTMFLVTSEGYKFTIKHIPRRGRTQSIATDHKSKWLRFSLVAMQ